ncbi:PQQ-like beta-propeller repeat protein [Catelliglobosispora koreensis]|uniref:PQQ-like beta-propeller repeat protein n=1 Tax=Catelliglobosispora koreensis TaxID=129052 RepID=UPI00146D38E1|nr:PQQ-like beta-propeller repeat protein [Catelliglobosispora koreensis]
MSCMTLRRPSASTLLAVILLLAVATVAGIAPAAEPAQAAGPYPKSIDLGRPPVKGVTTAGGETARMADGSYRTWLVVSGTTTEGDPAYLAEVDPFNGRMLNSYRMPTAGGGWGVAVSPDGAYVYAMTYGQGHAYRLKYTSPRSFTDLGAPTADTSFLWEGDTDDQGNLWIGTFQGFAAAKTPGLLASWRPNGGWTNHGGYGLPYEYVRSVEYARGQVYVGLGPQTRFYRHNPATGADTLIPLPPGVASDMYTYQLDDAGDYLYVYFAGGTSPAKAWLYNLVTQQWVRELPGYAGATVSDQDTDGTVYMVMSGELVAYQPVTGVVTRTGFTADGQLGAAKGILRATNPATGHQMIVTGLASGAIARYDLETQTGSYDLWDAVGLTPTLTPLRSVAMGPDGWAYLGGYFAGGFAGYDPDAERWHEYAWPHQVEGMATHGRKLYLGVYPNGALYEYDPVLPFGSGNPRKLFDLRTHGQERPWTVISAGRYVAIGTSPKNSKVDGAGAVTLYDPADGTHRVFSGIAGAGEIGALAYRNGILYGGSMNCCTAATPSDGTLFALNVTTGAKLWQTVPLAGERGVNGLAFGTDPNVIVGVTAGKAFRYNVTTRQLLNSTTLVSYPWAGIRNFSPRAVNLTFDPLDGNMYGTAVGRFLKLNPVSLANTAPAGWTGGFFAAANTGRKFATQTVNGRSHLIMSQWYGRPAAPAMLYGSTGSARMYRWESTEAAFVLGQGWEQASNYDLASVGDRFVSGDFTCDGVDDLATGYATGAGLRMDVWNGTATTAGPQPWATTTVATPDVGARMVAGDFDGNGCADIALLEAIGGTAGARIHRFLSDGQAFTKTTSGDWTTPTGYDLTKVAGRIAAGDVDRDGRDDIVTAYDYGGYFRYHVWKGATAYSGPSGWYQSGAFVLDNVADRMVVGDFDGDGDDEPAMFYHFGGSHARLFRWSASGSQFTLASPDWEVTSGYTLAMVGNRMAVGDANDDGRDDIIAAYDYGPDFRYHVWLSGWSYTGNTGWYDSGPFDLNLTGGRLVMGIW